MLVMCWYLQFDDIIMNRETVFYERCGNWYWSKVRGLFVVSRESLNQMLIELCDIGIEEYVGKCGEIAELFPNFVRWKGYGIE